MGNSIYHSDAICKSMLELGLPEHFRRIVLAHMTAILISVFVRGYRGKTVQISASSPRRRTTVAHFLNDGKRDDAELKRTYKELIDAFAAKGFQTVGALKPDRAVYPYEVKRHIGEFAATANRRPRDRWRTKVLGLSSRCPPERS